MPGLGEGLTGPRVGLGLSGLVHKPSLVAPAGTRPGALPGTCPRPGAGSDALGGWGTGVSSCSWGPAGWKREGLTLAPSNHTWEKPGGEGRGLRGPQVLAQDPSPQGGGEGQSSGGQKRKGGDEGGALSPPGSS